MHDDDCLFAEFITELDGTSLADFSKMIEESEELERKAFERKGKPSPKGDEENERD